MEPFQGAPLQIYVWVLKTPLSRIPQTIKPSHPDPGRIGKININFYFNFFLWCFTRFERFCGVIKPFEAPQRSENKNSSQLLF